MGSGGRRPDGRVIVLEHIASEIEQSFVTLTPEGARSLVN